ncbi:MAG: hypothetical protein GY757_33605 [bacterium]|nr:hypothetical protein [bacterium]
MKNCDEFSKAHNGKVKKEFEKYIKKRKRKQIIEFKWLSLALGESNSKKRKIHLSKDAFFYSLFEFVANKHPEVHGAENLHIKDYDDPSSNRTMYMLRAILGHEMLHAFTDIYKDILSIEDGKMSPMECEVMCLTRACLDPHSILKKLNEHLEECDEICERTENKAYCKDGKYTKCKRRRPKKTDSSGGPTTFPGSSQRKPDSPDDCYSYAGSNINFSPFAGSSVSFPASTGEDGLSNIYYPDVLVYNKYGSSDMDNLLNRFNPDDYLDDYVHDHFSGKHKVLIVPSAEFMGDGNSEITKQAFKQFLSAGNTILVLGQQYGDDLENHLPIDGPLKAYGFREDQSCLRRSAFFDTMHPALTSASSGIIDAGIDGYIPIYPSNSTVLLRRRINREPALLYFPSNGGHIILSAFFSDYAAAHNQLGASELKIFRDLVTFAKNMSQPIPMFNLEENPTPTISLNITAANETEQTAARAKLYAYTPDRKTLLYQTEETLTITPGQTVEIPLSFTLPELLKQDYGICHVDYELYDTENNLIQMPTESDSGRFSIYKITSPYTDKGGFYRWLTVKDEDIYWGQDLECTIHFKNITGKTQTLEVNNPYFRMGHGSGNIPFDSFSVEIPPGEEYAHVAKMSTESYNPYRKSTVTFRIQYNEPDGTLKQIGAAKLVFMMGALTQSTLGFTADKRTRMEPGSSFKYTVNSAFTDTPQPGNTTIKVVLEQAGARYAEYNEIETLYQTTHDFTTANTFAYDTTYTPPEVLPNGYYRLKTEVTAPNGLKEKALYQDFRYERSGFNLLVNSLQKNGETVENLIPGESYNIPISIKNPSTPDQSYDVKNGYCTILLKTGDKEVYRKELTAIAIAAGEEKELVETFTFTPVETGYYRLGYTYGDESLKPENVHNITRHLYKYETGLALIPGKSDYNYSDTAAVAVKIDGTGAYNLRLTCEEAGINEQRSVTVPAGTPGITETLEVPIGPAPVYKVKAALTDAAGLVKEKSRNLYVIPLKLDYQGHFNETAARAGSPLNLEIKIKGLSGMPNPLNGELAVNCTALNYEKTTPVLLQPGIDNQLTESIPISTDTPAGSYRFDVKLKINGFEFINKQHTIELPGAAAAFVTPADNYNAGDTIPLALENTGGKSGQYQIDIILTDNLSKEVHTATFNHTVNPGEKKQTGLTVPANVKSGRYLLKQEAKETTTSKIIKKVFAINLTGITATLESQTLKEAYLETETVTGQSTISAGNTSINNGLLEAQIIKQKKETGGTPSIEEIMEESLFNNCHAVDSQERLWVGTTAGLSRYDGSEWQHFNTLNSGGTIGAVSDITVGPGDKIYAVANAGIVVLENSATTVIPHPEYMEYNGKSTIAVDTLSRIWCIYYPWGFGELYLYQDEMWEGMMEWTECEKMISDGSGGVWLADEFLTHITPEFDFEEYDTFEWGLEGEPFQSLYLDDKGILWLTAGYEYASNWKLLSFDGTNYVDYSNYEGAPPNGVEIVTGNNEEIFTCSLDEGNLYKIETDRFVKIETKDFFVDRHEFDKLPALNPAEGYFYTIATSDDFEGGNLKTGLMKISTQADNNGDETVVWQNNYPVNIETGSTQKTDLVTGKQPEPGLYILKTRLVSSLNQQLAESDYFFAVRDSDVSVILSPGTAFKGNLKKNTSLPVAVKVFNNTSEDKSNLQLTVTKVSPTGEETEMLSETVSPAAGGETATPLTINETTTGEWQIIAGISEKVSGTETILSQTEMLLQVVEPLVTLAVEAPEFAGDDAFTIGIRLLNEGIIDTALHLQVMETDGGEQLMEKEITLGPLEERKITLEETITADRNYTVTVTGDVEKSAAATVQYGFKESVQIEMPPVLREGAVTIAGSIANTGGLAFQESLTAGIYKDSTIEPLYTFDRQYTLYPGAPAVADTLDMPLTPGSYRLHYKTGKNPAGQNVPFTVLPAGAGTVAVSGNTGNYPIGTNLFTYRITNTDTAAGSIPVTVTIAAANPQNTAVVLSETVNYYLKPGETVESTVRHDFLTAGNYILTITGAKLTAPAAMPIRVLEMDKVSTQLTVGTTENRVIPVNAHITNNGYREFSGRLVAEVDGIREEKIIEAAPGTAENNAINLDTALLVPGNKSVSVTLYDMEGEIAATTTGTTVLKGPEIRLTGIPTNLEASAGSVGEVTLELENTGNQRGDCTLTLRAFETLYQERSFNLEPGQKTVIADILFDVPADLPTGHYPFDYTLTGTGIEPQSRNGIFNIKVNGVALTVGAALNQSLYNVGETAQLTLDPASESAGNATLEAVVSWGNFSEIRQFILDSGSISLSFDIPL